MHALLLTEKNLPRVRSGPVGHEQRISIAVHEIGEPHAVRRPRRSFGFFAEERPGLAAEQRHEHLGFRSWRDRRWVLPPRLCRTEPDLSAVT